MHASSTPNGSNRALLRRRSPGKVPMAGAKLAGMMPTHSMPSPFGLVCSGIEKDAEPEQHLYGDGNLDRLPRGPWPDPTAHRSVAARHHSTPALCTAYNQRLRQLATRDEVYKLKVGVDLEKQLPNLKLLVAANCELDAGL